LIKHPSTPTFLKQAEEIASYILRTYPHARKIVELGVGFSPWVAIEIHKLSPHAKVFVVDKNPESLRMSEEFGLATINDDLTNPRISYYLMTDLFYSIHPPSELIEQMRLLSKLVKAPLLIKPLSEDSYFYGFHEWESIRLNTCILYRWPPSLIKE